MLTPVNGTTTRYTSNGEEPSHTTSENRDCWFTTTKREKRCLGIIIMAIFAAIIFIPLSLSNINKESSSSPSIRSLQNSTFPSENNITSYIKQINTSKQTPPFSKNVSIFSEEREI